MKCPNCDSIITQCIDSRPINKNTKRYRRYKCLECEQRFTTYERYKKEDELEVLIDKED